jgi:signal transduction histidine kinase
MASTRSAKDPAVLITQQHIEPSSATTPAGTNSRTERWREPLGAGARWLAAWALAFGLTMGLVAVTLHPPAAHLVALTRYLLAGGTFSLLTAVALHAATRTGRLSGARARFAMPVALTAVVISVNVLIVAQQMFLAQPDTMLVLAILVFGIVLAVSASMSLAEATASALRRLEASARKMAAGEYSVRVPEDDLGGGAEVARLGRWFNQMAMNVEGAFDHQRCAERERRELVAALSHDLRTPLASIRAMIEAITDGVVTEQGTVDRYQRSIRGEVRHLSTLMDDLFELARLEALPDATRGLQREVVALEDVLSDTLEMMREQASTQDICLSGGVEGDLPPIKVDARQIHRVLTNLVQNALCHTRCGGHIAIRAAYVGGTSAESTPHIIVHVVDDGVGIAQHDLPHIFEPTFRGERSRHREAIGGQDVNGMGKSAPTGAGLGLAIARGLVEAHGGTLRAESPLSPASMTLLTDATDSGPVVGPGTCLAFTLPL